MVQGDNKEWFGAGHNSAYTFDGKDYIIIMAMMQKIVAAPN